MASAPSPLWGEGWTDEELQLVMSFMEARNGRHGVFSFFDPWDETEYINCSLESDLHELRLDERARSAITIVIRQN